MKIIANELILKPIWKPKVHLYLLPKGHCLTCDNQCWGCKDILEVWEMVSLGVPCMCVPPFPYLTLGKEWGGGKDVGQVGSLLIHPLDTLCHLPSFLLTWAGQLGQWQSSWQASWWVGRCFSSGPVIGGSITFACGEEEKEEEAVIPPCGKTKGMLPSTLASG